MLGRTANGLYWMYRYLERAENTVRFIETGQRIALTRSRGSDDEWRSVLETAGTLDAFEAQRGDITAEAAVDWLLRDTDNPSSVLSCILAARQNARMVRTALTSEVWEAVNETYMKAKDVLARKVAERDLPAVLATMRQRVALVRGTTDGTMLRNDIYDFARIGTYLERADNTARILDVKYYVLLPSVMAVCSIMDNVQWETILRSVSARGGFRMEYGNMAGPREIAQFLILDARMPRSLAYCTAKIRSNLGYLVAPLEEPARSLRMVEEMQREYLGRDIGQIVDSGLHEFIQAYMARLGTLGRQVEQDFRFYD